MISKINQITSSLDGTIAQINQMSTAIQNMSQKFSEETISVNENIRLIVEVLKQFRMKSSENLQTISDDFKDANGKASRVGFKMDGDNKVRFAKTTGDVI